MSERQNMCNFLKSQVRRNTGYPPPFRTDLGGGYPPLLGKNYTPLENLQISVKIEKWARFGMAAHLWVAISFQKYEGKNGREMVYPCPKCVHTLQEVIVALSWCVAYVQYMF